MIIGNSEKVFGLKVEPEHYREFLDGISNLLIKNKISQHIMTDFKFTELIRQSCKLGYELSDITFFNEERYLDDEVIQEVKNALWQSDIDLVLGSLLEAIDNGHNILSITGDIQNINGDLEQMKIYSNGTISVSSKQRVERYPIIDFIIEGPEVIL